MSNECSLKIESNSTEFPTNGLALPELEFRAEDYSDLVGELSLSDAEANEFLLTLWNIMRIFAQMGLRPDGLPMKTENSSEKTGVDSAGRVEIFNTASSTEKG
jgi:hypothetical protein